VSGWEAIGWVGTFIAMGGYFLSVRQNDPRILHTANAISVWGIAASAIYAQAWPSLAITTFFGAVGFWGLIKGEHQVDR